MEDSSKIGVLGSQDGLLAVMVSEPMKQAVLRSAGGVTS